MNRRLLCRLSLWLKGKKRRTKVGDFMLAWPNNGLSLSTTKKKYRSCRPCFCPARKLLQTSSARQCMNLQQADATKWQQKLGNNVYTGVSIDLHHPPETLQRPAHDLVAQKQSSVRGEGPDESGIQADEERPPPFRLAHYLRRPEQRPRLLGRLYDGLDGV